MWVLCIVLSVIAAACTCRSGTPRATRRARHGMSRRARDLLLGVALAAVTFAGVAWQAGATTPDGAHNRLPSLICPLH